MENNHKLGLYVSYYLSRFDKEAYNNLGLGNQSETHNKIGELLSVKPHTVKNWRDEFDPLFGHRAGWHQRPMNPSRIRVAQALENLDEIQVRGIAEDILSGKILEEPEEEQQLLSIATEVTNKKATHKFIPRGPTGKAAEEYFQMYYDEYKKPVAGTLIDCRDLGVGYDFRIETIQEKYFVEVKGISKENGGVLFTNKEWSTAKIKGDNFFLCIVSNLHKRGEIMFIQNPACKLTPRRNLYTSIEVNWSIPQKEFSRIK